MIKREQGRAFDGWAGGSDQAVSRAALALAATALAAGAAGPASAQTATAAQPPATAAPPVQPAPSAHKPKSPAPKPPVPKAKKPPTDDDDDDDEPVVVTPVTVKGHRPPPPQPGAVVGDIKPELQLAPADIQSYGVSTVTELLNELAPQTRSDRGRGASAPVVLLNGRRISSLNEIQNIPTEAILRVDILPEEVSLKYGYTADQRVVNFVLKRRFHSITGEIVGGQTTEGGDASGQAEVDQFQVRRDTRLNLDLKYQVAAGLTDADRNLSETATGAPFDLAGNVVSPTAGAQIDPALSALVGRPVTVAGVPSGVSAGQRLTLQDFAPTAGAANVTNTAADHSLLPATQQLTANAVMARPIFAGINATFNATLGATSSYALQGLPGVSLLTPAGDPFSPFSTPVTVDRYVAGQSPLKQTIDGWTAHLGVTFNRDIGNWRLSLTTAYNHSDTETVTGTGVDASGFQTLLNQASPSFNPFGPLPAGVLSPLPQSIARSITDGGNMQVLANGPLLKLPAGAVYVSAKVGDSEALGSSSSLRAGLFQAQSLSRNDVSAQLNVDVPLASRTHHVLGVLGELSVNVNSAVDDYSDFGALPTLGYGVNWTPVPGYNLIFSETHDHLAPTIQQLEGPMVETPGTRIFDYATGQTVAVTQISGGNRALTDDSRDVKKIGLTLKPFPDENFTLTANYIDSHIDNPIETFPSASAAIEAAFPDRFIRNAQGELEEEDDRPLNFASQDREELRWGINYSRPVGKQPPPPRFDRRAFARRRNAATGGQNLAGAGGSDGLAASGAAAGGGGSGEGRADTASGTPGSTNPPGDSGGPSGGGARPGGGRDFGGGGFGGGGRGGRGGGGAPVGGRFQIAFYHTVIFKDQFLVARNGPVLDLLNGAAAGSTGGQYQHEIEGQLGYTENGYGLRLSADWRSATNVVGGAAGSTGNLDFSDVSTINLRLWDDFSQQRALIARYPLLRGVRLTLNVNNLFDQSIKVRDSAGPTPAIYQSAFLDPTGRVISINLRKLFY
jgi:iron complex outermembrane recepter protein